MKPGYQFGAIGGRLALDFCDTVSNVYDPAEVEYLEAYDDVVTWAEQRGGLGRAAAKQLRAAAASQPREARAVLERTIALRRALQLAFIGAGEGRPPSSAELAVVNRELARALAQLSLKTSDGATSWEFREGAHLDRILWPVARDAAELLTSPELLARVRPCPSESCGWLFLDESKNNRRRWCDMASCGNRAKARRHYAKTRES